MRRSWGVWMLACLVAACGEGAYLYQPTAMVAATVDGAPASRYPVPPESPRGEVLVASFGLTRMDRADGAASEFVHARLVVSNNNDVGPWTVDPGRQLLAVPGQTPIAPAYVSSDGQVAPEATVAPGQKLTLDLFYPTPPRATKASALPAFDLLWNVQTPARTVAERTSFERLQVAPPPEPYGSYAWATGWWADPWWYGPVGPGYFWRDPLAPRFVGVRRPSHIVVHRPRYVARPAPPPHATPRH